jgi:hypothetical protein
MGIATYEAVVENGQIRLVGDVRLQEHARVYVIVPDVATPAGRIASPRLAHPEQVADFVLQFVEENHDAGE